MKNYAFRMPALNAVLLLIFSISACKKAPSPLPHPSPPKEVLIDGKKYPIIIVGSQTWTAANHSGPGGVPYNNTLDKPEYGRYYTFVEAHAVPLPDGWRIPTMEDYKRLAQAQGVVFTNERATNQEAIKKLVSTNHWRKIAGTNTSGFNGYPAGYIFENSGPLDGDICEYWTDNGITLSIQEGANGLNHNLMFYQTDKNPDYRFNLRFVKDN
jgi:uncharacterized protein (TIGR02145 family)